MDTIGKTVSRALDDLPKSPEFVVTRAVLRSRMSAGFAMIGDGGQQFIRALAGWLLAVLSGKP